MNNHIRVVSHQNDELTREIDQFVQANEVIRSRLDRKQRVMELREKNDYNLQQSMNQVTHSKSPVRQRYQWFRQRDWQTFQTKENKNKSKSIRMYGTEV